MRAQTLRSFLESYLLYHDLKPETAEWYRRIVSVFCSWAGDDVLIEQFNGEGISLLLADKKALGRSPHYCRSLRNGLVALLNELRGDAPRERVRAVKTPPLDPDAWTPAEVERLLRACDHMPEASAWRWKLMIALAYYTGLDRCDLERVERRNIDSRGTLTFRRSKTGKLVVVAIPKELLAFIDARCPQRGPIVRMGISKEWFRRIFARIVRRAKLQGTFKKLRKTSGSAVEQATPGTGHQHLANTRAIFERHYESHRITRAKPTKAPEIEWPGE